eukprot:TRINITY_DN74203_c0_g1_i1.p1 TRINITY_DN74203_c0_g1~~TRINITY_DN74203_c0_g1_i1.p1  ORF type:complete len:287 (-),score=38.33 TRINITY_DN74203_c0_g1_i1:257-1117(-)
MPPNLGEFLPTLARRAATCGRSRRLSPFASALPALAPAGARWWTSDPVSPASLTHVVEDPAWGPSRNVPRWGRKTRVKLDPTEMPARGAHNTQEYDERHGRWWVERKETTVPKLFTTIGRHAKDPKLNNHMLRWVINTPAYKKLLRDAYRKRWPKLENLNVKFFAEFCLKDFEKRTLLETAHCLPLFGVGCKFWRGKTPDTPDTKGQYLIAESAEYKLRPIRGKIRGTQHMLGKPLRSGVAPIAKTLGSWCYSFPKGAHPAVYRPPFPRLASETNAAGDADAEQEE